MHSSAIVGGGLWGGQDGETEQVALMVQVAIGLARGLHHLYRFRAGLPVWQLGADANCELAGAKRTGKQGSAGGYQNPRSLPFLVTSRTRRG